MSIFSLFGKKDDRTTTSADKDSSRKKRQPNSSRSDTGQQRGSARTIPTVRTDEQTARATAMKIDAIESEMSSEFTQTVTIHPHNTVALLKSAQNAEAKPPQTLQSPTMGMGTTTEFLLGGQTAVAEIEPPSSEAAAAIEEAAILYANGQGELAEQMLRNAIEEDWIGDATRNAWGMLFDLYQIAGKQEDFENLSIAYASKFETSPPPWTGGTQAQRIAAPANTTSAKPFTGALDGSAAKQVERVRKLAESHRRLRLEFARVAAVDPQGCRLLLDLLRSLQKSGHDLILVGAPELADKIRAILEVGRRGDTEDAWLLLLEVLRLLNREKEFEEASIDYCVTFEVSPPAFTAPQNKITTAATEAPPPAAEGFMMPALIEGSVDSLIVAIVAYSDKYNPAIVDCSQLARIDFNAAGRLLTGLVPFCDIGKSIEFHHVNRLVAELFNVIGLKDIARIVPRKN